MKSLSILFLFTTIAINTQAQTQNNKTDSLLVEYYQTQKYAEAADLLKRTYPEPVNNLKVVSQLAYANSMAGKLPEAEKYYQRLYEADSTNLSVLFNMAGIANRRGNAKKAAEFYKHILAIDSTNFNVYKQLATISTGKGDIPNAINYLQKANKINPADPDVAFDLSAFYISFHNDAQAEKVIDLALKADTANLLLLKGKAQVCYTQGKFAEAITVCKKLLSNFDRSSTVISYKGVAEFNTKKYADCINTFAMLDSANTQTETGYYYTGLSYKSLKNNSKAIYYLQKAIDEGISPNIGSYYSEIADSYDKLHLPKKAVIAYQRGLTFGEKSMVYYALASVYDTSLRDTANAIKYYKRYLASKPAEKDRSYVEYTMRRISDLSR